MGSAPDQSGLGHKRPDHPYVDRGHRASMFDDVLVPVDGSDAAVRAAVQAIELARSVGATVHAVFVVDESPENVLLSRASMATLLEELHERGTALTREVTELADDVPVETAVVQSVDVPDAILHYAADHGVELVVMGTRGRHGIEHLLGSTTERVLARSAIPVLVVPAPEGESGVDTDVEHGE